ncbi:MAG: hotdog fold thioesterase [Cyclobacteriaceae bacterium]
MIFKKNPGLDFLNQLGKDSMIDHLEIRFTAIGADFLEAEMPVNAKTKQPFGLLHGGANVVLAESMASVGAFLTLESENQQAAGLEINANHLRAVYKGKVKGTAKPLHVGRTTQVWEIKIHNEEGKLSCISRITLAIIDR